jgi:peptidyl-prolyl cis-trans isomerase C
MTTGMAFQQQQPHAARASRAPGRLMRGGVLVLALTVGACAKGEPKNGPPEPGDVAAARVAGETIWVSDVKRQAVAQGQIGEGEPLDVASDQFRRTLDEVIDQKLLAREAARLKLEAEPIAKRRLDAARERLLGDILVESVVDKAVNENAIRALYEEQKRLSQTSEELKGRQILLASQAEAEAVKKLIDTGANFEALAMQRSTDQATRFNGGDLGYFTLDSMPEAYGAALKAAPKGTVVGPFASDAGWVLMRIEDRRPEAAITMEEARPQIVRFLTYDQIRTLLNRLRGQTKVDVLLARPADQPGTPVEPANAPPATAASAPAASAPAPAPAATPSPAVAAKAATPSPAKTKP